MCELGSKIGARRILGLGPLILAGLSAFAAVAVRLGWLQSGGAVAAWWLGALAYWAAQAIRDQYLKNPGPLVQA